MSEKKSNAGWPSKEKGKDSGKNRDNNPPKPGKTPPPPKKK